MADLEKTSETTAQENGVLRAQINRLQAELIEYKKRLSNNIGLAGSPPNGAFTSLASMSRGSTGASDFQFDFTKFGQNSSFRHMSSGTSASNTNPQSRQNSRSSSPSQFNSLTSSWTGMSSNTGSQSQALTNNNVANNTFFNNLSNLGNVNFGAGLLDLNTPAQNTSCPSLCHDDTRSSGASPAASTPLDPFTSEGTSPTPINNDTAQPAKTADNLNFEFSNYTDGE